jgi:tRNA (cytosine49-C5)-methyltransferase
MDTLEFKPKFIERYEKLTDFEEFRKISNVYLRRSIRVNTLKSTVSEIKKRLSPEWDLTPVPWCKEGFWINHRGEGDEHRRDVGNIPEHSLGYFFIQEAASMIPPLALEPKPGERILDMCASPGSKTTQIGQYMKNEGVLISNDYKYDRLKPLAMNLQRMGVMNCLVNLSSGRYFKGLECDRILVDAPCSGTGTIRKSWKTLRIWNPNMIRRLAGTQKQLIDTAYENLKQGGTLVYSTCSLEPEEDEGVVSYFLAKHPDMKLVPFELPGLKRSKPVLEFGKEKYNPAVKDCLRIWPQDNDTEGFFVAKFVRS